VLGTNSSTPEADTAWLYAFSAFGTLFNLFILD